MNALWIIDLCESEDAVKAFFDSYWAVFLENLKDPAYPAENKEPWFHVSTPKDLGLTMDNLPEKDDEKLSEIGTRVYNAVRKADNLISRTNGLIKYPFSTRENVIMVAVLGRIDSPATQRFFLPFATSLKIDTQQPTRWNYTPNVYFYGMLYRREEVAFGTHLTDAEKAFLNQLHNMQMGWSTFDHVLFFEKPAEKKEEAIKDMALAALHLGYERATDPRVLGTYSNREPIPVYLNAGASGIFFEREVQNDREAFLLGHTLMDPFVNSTSAAFYDQESAKARAKDIPVFRNGELDETTIYRRLSSKMPELDTSKFDIPMPVKPGSPNVREVWPRYFGAKDGYIANLKARLVNTVKLKLAVYEQEYLKKLSDNQFKWIEQQSAAIEEGIFGVFDDEHPDAHCSMHQAIEVAKQAEILAASKAAGKAEDLQLLESDGLPISPIVIPKRYEKAYSTARLGNDDVTEGEVLEELDKKLRRHPVFMFSMFSRALLMAIILFGLCIFSNPFLAIGLFILPFVVYFLVYRHHMNILKSLQERYVGLSLYRLNEKLVRTYKDAIHKSQCDIRDYCKWNWEDRLSTLRNNIGVFVPKSFHFQPSEDFQPLLTDNLHIETKDLVKRVGRNEGAVEDAPAMTSGEFDGLPILKDVPGFKVKLGWDLQPKCVMDLTEIEKQRLIQDLMKETAYVPQQMEENLDPAKMVLKTAGSAVLMLDVSGSMSGQPHEDLKEAVKTLKDKFNDQIRWVAFADRAVMDHDVGDDLDKAESICGGGTSYVPAFELLIQAKEQGLLNLGKLIIISDGCPFDEDESRKKILELGCVVDVIFIGYGGEVFLKGLAESTGGTMQQVQDVRNAQIETVVEEGIKTGFKLANEGNFHFGDLLRKSAIKPCMKALLKFTKGVMITSDLCIERMIADFGNPPGLQNWLVNRAKECAMNYGVFQQPIDIHIKSSGIEQEAMCTTLTRAAFQFTGEHRAKFELVIPVAEIGNRDYRPDSPDVLVTQLHIRPLSGIRDLSWGFDPENDKQLSSDDVFSKLYQSYFRQYRFVNIFDHVIE